MRPLTVLIGILMGSTVAIALGLGMVLIIFLILSDEHAQLRAEYGPLLRATALFSLLAGAATASFVGELRNRPWRRVAQAALVLGLAAAVWVYLPRPTM
jgi:hypothetical protein